MDHPSAAEAAEVEAVEEGVVNAEVHVLVLGEELEGEGVGTGGEAHPEGVAHAPVVPVAGSSLRHDEGADAVAVDGEGADGAFVLGVDGSVAVGVSEGDAVEAPFGHGDGGGDGAGGVVSFHESLPAEALEGCAGHILRLGGGDGRLLGWEIGGDQLGIAAGLRGERLHALAVDADHLIFAGDGGEEGGLGSGGHLLAVAEHDVVVDILDGIPLQAVVDRGEVVAHRGVVGEPCHRGEGRLDVGHLVDAHQRGGVVGHDDADGILAADVGGDEGCGLLLAVEVEFLNVRTVARDGDIEHRVAVVQSGDRAVVGEGFGHEGLEADAVGLVVDAEKQIEGDGEIAREAPEHVGGIELSADVAVVEDKILLVGGEESRRAEYRTDPLHHTLLIAHLGVGEGPVGCYPGP